MNKLVEVVAMSVQDLQGNVSVSSMFLHVPMEVDMVCIETMAGKMSR